MRLLNSDLIFSSLGSRAASSSRPARILVHRYAGEQALTGVDYWQWRGNPESREICPELTQLLELPVNQDASRVLERLADGRPILLLSIGKPQYGAKTGHIVNH